MHKHVENVVGYGIYADKLVQSPKGSKHQRVIDRPRAGPDFLQSERANNARILGQMRFIIPNEAGVEDAGICYKNQSDQKEPTKPVPLPGRSSPVARFAEKNTVGKHGNTMN